MKKLNILLTLLVSSFFLFSTNVKADTITFEVSESEMSYITNEDFLLLRDKTIEYCKQNNMYYFISTNDGYVFSSSIFEYIDLKGGMNTSSNLLYIDPAFSYKNYQIRNGVFTRTGSGTSSIDFGSNSKFTYKNFLDTNLENIIYTGSKDFIFQYNDLSLPITNGSHFPTLYDIYMEYNQIEVPDVDPKAEIITNFYTIVIQKIGLFADLVTNNYIVFSSAVIFMFVALFGLVRRIM